MADYSQYWQNLSPAFAPAHKPTYADVQAAFQQYLGHAATDVTPWANDPNYQQNIWNSPEAQQYRQNNLPPGMTDPNAPPPDTSTPPPAAATSVDPNDPRAALSQLYTNAGLDPNNPGSGLADVGYFLDRMNQTGGWQGSNQQYWLSRVQQEIQKYQTGAVGNLIDTSPGGAGGGTAAATQANFPPAFTYQPWTQTFQGPQWTGGDFVAPTNVTEQNDPGYQARLAAGLKAMQQSAAAQGTVLTGGTVQAENQYAQDYASNEYANVYNRALGQYQQSYQQYLNNYSQAAQNYQQNYQQYLNNYQQSLQQYGTQYGAASDAYNRAWQQYLQQYNAGQQAWQNQQYEQGQQWNRYSSLLGMGMQAAGAPNPYAELMPGLLTGQGNAAAAGQVGAGNAYGNMLGNLGNLGMTGLSLYGANQGWWNMPKAGGGGSSGGGGGLSAYGPW